MSVMMERIPLAATQPLTETRSVTHIVTSQSLIHNMRYIVPGQSLTYTVHTMLCTHLQYLVHVMPIVCIMVSMNVYSESIMGSPCLPVMQAWTPNLLCLV